MPGIETLPRSTPEAAGTAFDGVANKRGDGFSGRHTAGDDFDGVMQATINSRGQKPPDKNPLHTPHKTPAGRSSQSDTSTTATGGTDSGDRILGKKIEGDKKQVLDADGNISPDENTPAVDVSVPLPVFLSLPFFPPSPFFDRPVNPASGEQAGSLEKISADQTAAGFSALAIQPAGDKSIPGRLTPMAGSLVTTITPALVEKTDKNGGNAPTEVKTAQTEPGEKAALDLLAKSNPVVAVEPAKDLQPASPVEPADAPANMPKTPETAASSLIEKAMDAGGTGVAIEGLQMKNQQKTNKVAGPDVKVLPVGEPGEVRPQNLPPQMLVPPVRATQNNGTDLNFSFSNGNQPAPQVENAPVVNIIDLPSLADARMRALDRTHDMMSLHSMRLVESKSDVLSVIIKPAVGTELSLELRQHPDGVEARATLTRGDHQFLSQHWGDLQQRLEQRGIRLAPLDGGASFSAGDNRQFQQQQAAQEEAAQQASAFAEFATLVPVGGASARLASIHEGWESWA